MLNFVIEDNKTILQSYIASVIFLLTANKKPYRTIQIKLLEGKSDLIYILFQ